MLVQYFVVLRTVINSIDSISVSLSDSEGVMALVGTGGCLRVRFSAGDSPFLGIAATRFFLTW